MPTPVEPLTLDVPALSHVDPPVPAPMGSDEALADPVPAGLAGTLRRSERFRRKPNMYGDWDHYAVESILLCLALLCGLVETPYGVKIWLYICTAFM